MTLSFSFREGLVQRRSRHSCIPTVINSPDGVGGIEAAMWLILSPLSWLLVAVLVACTSVRLRFTDAANEASRGVIFHGCALEYTTSAGLSRLASAQRAP